MDRVFQIMDLGGLNLLLEIAHVTFAAVWFGSQVAGAEDLKRTLQLPDAPTDWVLKRQERLGLVSLAGALLTVFTGSWLILGSGGFGTVHPRHSFGFMMTLILLGVDARLMRPTWRKITEMIQAGNLESSGPLLTNYRVLQWLSRLLWIVIVGLMVWDP